MCRKAGVTLNVVHEVDSMVGGLTLVSADMGIAFSTPSLQRLWPDIAFRPIFPTVNVEQAVAYNHDRVTPVLEIFLRAVRQVVRKKGSSTR